jgi:Arc/MetJ family transcription regulator
MSTAVKTKIYQLLDGIEDEAVLNQVMEDVAFYATKKDIVDQLSPDQLKELDKAIEEADNKETILWGDFKKEMKEWKKK